MIHFSRRSLTFPTRFCIVIVSLFYCFFTASSASGRPGTNRASHDAGHSGAEGALTTINLRDYGALGDGVADDGQALQRALDALALSGGGTLHVPSGHYLLITPVHKDFAPSPSVTIEGEPSSTPIDVAGNGAGLDLTSEFIVAVGGSDAIALTGLNCLRIKDLAFVGVQEVFSDARVVVN